MAENQVKVNQADTVPNYLFPKLQAGHGISLKNNGSSIRIDALGNPGDRKVLVDSADETPGFLAEKLEAGTGVTLNNTGSAIEINANTQTGDHKVIITSADSSPDYLDEKIKAGTNVTITNQGTYLEISSTDTGMLNPMTSAGDLIVGGVSGDPDRLGVGTNGQVLTVTSGAPSWASIPTQTGDHKVLATSADTSPNYLDQKLSGSGVVAVTDNTTSLSVGITPSSTDGQVLTTDNGAVAWKTPATQTGDHKVVVDSNDTNPQYLGVKLKSGAGVNISYYNHDKMEIASLGQVKVALLGTMDYLGNKILQGSGITLTKTNNDITIAADTQTGDHKVLASSGDSTADYLGNKLVQGSGITLTKGTDDITIAADTQTGDHKVLATSDDTTSAGALADKLYVFSPLVQSTATAGGVKRVTFKINAGADGKVLTSNSGNVSWETPATQTGDHKVIIDSNDSTPGYLASKLTAGSNVTITNNGTDLEISAADTGFANPMTAKGDLIAGGVSGAPYALSMGTAGQVLTSIGSDIAWSDLPGYVKVGSSDTSPDYLGNKLVQGSGISFTTSNNQITIAADTQTGDHKVLADSTDVTPSYLSSKIVVGSGLVQSVVTPFADFNKVRIALDTAGASSGQILSYDGVNVAWTNQVQIPKRIDWTVETAFINGTFNQTLDRTFYVEMFPECEFFNIDAMVAVLDSSNSGDEWRVAVFDNTRTMTYYGTSTGVSQNFRKFTSLTKLTDHTFDANNVYYLAISQHTAGNANSKLKTAAVTSPAYCWYEDVALTSGRAMPATSSLVAVSGKVPAIGLRGR